MTVGALPLVINDNDSGHEGHHESVHELMQHLASQQIFDAAGFGKGLLSARPAAAAGDKSLWYATDVPSLTWSDGTTWHDVTQYASMDLPEYAIGSLPAAGTPGRLAHVTDSIRGVWMDATTRWVSLNAEAVYVEEYYDTGGTTDQAAIQAAITAAAARPGCEVHFKPGKTYVLDAPPATSLMIPVTADNIRLVGHGATLSKSTQIPDPTTTAGYPYTSEIPLYSILRIGGTSSESNSDNFVLFVIIEDLRFVNNGSTSGSGTDAGYWTTRNGSAATYNRHYTPHQNHGAGIYAKNFENLVIQNCHFSDCGIPMVLDRTGNAVDDTHPSSASVINNRIMGWGFKGIASSVETYVAGNHIEQLSARESLAEATGHLGPEHGVDLSSAAHGSRIIGNRIKGVTYSGFRSVGILDWSSNPSLIAHNIFEDCFLAGTCGSTSLNGTPNGTMIANNSFLDCGALEVGIVGSDSDDVHFVTGNLFRGGSLARAAASAISNHILTETGHTYIVSNTFLDCSAVTGSVSIGFDPAVTAGAASYIASVRGNYFGRTSAGPAVPGGGMIFNSTPTDSEAELFVENNTFDKVKFALETYINNPSNNVFFRSNLVRAGSTTYQVLASSGMRITSNDFEILPAGGAINVLGSGDQTPVASEPLILKNNRYYLSPTNSRATYTAINWSSTTFTSELDMQHEEIDKWGVLTSPATYSRAFTKYTITTGGQRGNGSDVYEVSGSVNSIEGGFPGKRVLLRSTTTATIVHTVNSSAGNTIELQGSTNFSMAAGNVLELVWLPLATNNGCWVEVGRHT